MPVTFEEAVRRLAARDGVTLAAAAMAARARPELLEEAEELPEVPGIAAPAGDFPPSDE